MSCKQKSKKPRTNLSLNGRTVKTKKPRDSRASSMTNAKREEVKLVNASLGQSGSKDDDFERLNLCWCRDLSFWMMCQYVQIRDLFCVVVVLDDSIGSLANWADQMFLREMIMSIVFTQLTYTHTYGEVLHTWYVSKTSYWGNYSRRTSRSRHELRSCVAVWGEIEGLGDISQGWAEPSVVCDVC